MNNYGYILHTDGCCRKNRVGGIGMYLEIYSDSDEYTEISRCKGYKKPTTNQRMELRAGIEGLKLIREERKKFGYGPITWFTDSKYISSNVYNFPNWRKYNKWETKSGEPVSNKSLWRELEAIRSKLQVLPTKIPEKENKIADKLSKEGAKSPIYDDLGFNPGRVGTSYGGNKDSANYYIENSKSLKIKVYLVGGEENNGKCKVRFQIIEGINILLEKYYVWAETKIAIHLHRFHMYLINTRLGNIIESKELN
jgi:ribonuclease HI